MKQAHIALCMLPAGAVFVGLSGHSPVAASGAVTVAPVASDPCGCGPDLSISGSFGHRAETFNVSSAKQASAIRAFREAVDGSSFTVTISQLPAGTYKLVIKAMEPTAMGPNQRVFDVMAGDQVIAKNLDLFVAAGSVGKVATITGNIEHADDGIRGPLKISFVASRGTALFNSIAILNAQGDTVASFAAADVPDSFSAAATKAPDVRVSAFWRDPKRSLGGREDDLIRRMSLAEKVSELKNDAPAIARLGLPAFNYWNEALHGVANNGAATVFPEPIGGAASWDPALFKQEGRVIGIEGRAKYNDYANQHGGDSKWWYGLTYWTPNVNIFRDPRWGRGQETYGEDPFLTGEIGVQFVKGIQGDDPRYMLAMACAKHYAVHSGPESDRHRFDAVPSETDFYDTYLPQFERVVREGHVAGVMGSYNSVFGVPACASTLLLHDLLRTQWGFDGYVVSDCGAIGDIWQGHHYVKTPEEAAAAALKAGTDLSCGGDYNALVRAVQKGLVNETDIDNALKHTLWTRFRLGLFDPADQVPYSKYTIKDNDTAEHEAIALDLARQSIVLLKNDGVLPIDRSKVKTIAVIGPNSDSKSMLEGNYHGSSSRPVSILAGIRQLAGPGIDVEYAIGSPVTTQRGNAPYSRQDNETTRPVADLSNGAVALAQRADLVIYVGGITAAQEGESFDRKKIELPDEQEALLHALYATGKPIVMVNCSGSAVALDWEDEHLPAIAQAWYPGEQGGRAVAEVLFGQVNPSGHLPVTFYRSTADLPAFTDYSMAHRTYRFFGGKPLYAFGHGLSYTKFEFSRGSLGRKSVHAGDTVRLTFTIKNAGAVDGDEVTQVYFRRESADPAAPKVSLCGFKRVRLKQGSSAKVSFEIPVQRLRHWDMSKKRYVVDPGNYQMLVGDSSDAITLTEPLTVTR